jgi:hypothetical protein
MIATNLFRENPAGAPHGAVHVLAHIHGKPRGTTLICGADATDMRHCDPGFRGYMDLLHDGCAEALAAGLDALERPATHD